MSTIISPEISKKKPYHIPKHRYYELKHFCLQYPEWKKKLSEIDISNGSSLIKVTKDSIEFKDPTFSVMEAIDIYERQIEMVESCAVAADPTIANYILEAVCFGKTFEELKTLRGIPCGRSYFYNAYRKFFWYLDKLRT